MLRLHSESHQHGRTRRNRSLRRLYSSPAQALRKRYTCGSTAGNRSGSLGALIANPHPREKAGERPAHRFRHRCSNRLLGAHQAPSAILPAIPTSELEAYCRKFIDVINARGFTHSILQCIAPDLQVNAFDVFPKTYSLAKHINTVRNTIFEGPAYHIEVRYISVSKDEEGTPKDVFITIKVTERSLNVERDSLWVLSWTKKSDAWRRVSHVGMRAFNLMDGY